MEKAKQNKAFIIEYFNALSGEVKTLELCKKYMTDQKLIDHIQFFEGAFPRYELIIEEIVADDNRIIVKAHASGVHEGDFDGIPPTYNKMDLPFVVRYTVENNMITDHWLMADQSILMKQLGVVDQETVTN